MTDDEKLIHNERTKIMATWLNTLASGAIITGVLAPTIAVIFGFQAATSIDTLLLVGSALI